MNVFITGGSRGVGAQLVEDLVNAGYHVAFTFNESREEASKLVRLLKSQCPSQKCKAYKLDVRNSQDVDKVAETVLADFESIQVIILNAGINRNELVVTTTDEQWLDVMDTNLNGAFYTCRAFLPSMLINGFGRLIFISSVAHDGSKGHAGYAASKAGLIGLAQSLAKEYGRKGITSNSLILGYFPTDMTQDGLADSVKEFWVKSCPVGRMGKLSEISHAVKFLSSEEASFINGVSLPVTGGLNFMP